MKHIAITYPFPLGAASGGARMTREIAAHLGRLGLQVTLLPVSGSPLSRYPRPALVPEAQGFEFDRELLAAGVTVQRVPPHPAHWALDGLAVRRELANLLRTHPVDAVLSYYHEAAFLPGFLKQRGIPFGYISTWQSYALALHTTPLKRLMDSFLVKRPHRLADIFFPTSEFTKGELVSLLGVDGSRARVCYLGVEPAFFQIPRTYRRPVRNLVFFGRIVYTKGVADALAALGKLKKEGLVDWQFRMMGSGKHGWAQTLAGQHGVAEQVEILPPVGDEDLQRELAAADLAFMPSHAEAFGLSIAEAQASGLPVVAYRTGSVPEVVADGKTGWLAPFRDVNALAETLKAALSDPAEVRRRGEAARERVGRLFTWENTARTIDSGLTELV